VDLEVKESFFKYLQYEKRYSFNTIKAYHIDLDQFFEFIEQSQAPFSIRNVEAKLIRNWIVGLMDSGVSSRSVNRKISTLKTFFKFLKREGVADENPMPKIITPKSNKTLPHFIPENSINQFLDNNCFGDDAQAKRNKLIMELFYSTGIRVAELISIKLNQIDVARSVILITGKRNKQRFVPLTAIVKQVIDDYLQVRCELLGNQQSDFLFITNRGEALYPRLVYRLVNGYLNLVTTDEKKSPHVLRHTFATHMLNNGAELNTIKELLGHTNLSATEIYTHNTFEKLKRVYKQAHPRA